MAEATVVKGDWKAGRPSSTQRSGGSESRWREAQSVAGKGAVGRGGRAQPRVEKDIQGWDR